jgi:hypothetical protein
MGGPVPWRTIVGVVNDVKHAGLDRDRTPQFYQPADQWMWAENGFMLVVRAGGDPGALAAAVRAAIAGLDPDLAVSDVATGSRRVETSTADRRLVMRLFTIFAAIALLLAAAGTYGLLARRVAARHREWASGPPSAQIAGAWYGWFSATAPGSRPSAQASGWPARSRFRG